MSGSIFLYLDFIPGESTAHGFDSWIDVASFSLGCTMEVDQDARTGSGGGSTGSGDPEDLSLDKKMDVATTALLYCCASGAVIPRGKLMQFNDVGSRVLVSEYAIGDSMITNISLSASGGGIPDESVSINYGSIIWSYHCYDHFRPYKPVPEGDTFRAWSLISSRPGYTDQSVLTAKDIGKDYDLENPEDGSDHKNSYWSISRGPIPEGFPEKKSFRMPKPNAENYEKT